MYDPQPWYGPPPGYGPQPSYGPPPGYGTPPGYGSQPGYGPRPPRAPISGRLIAAVFGIVALAGMLCTLLPMWTISINPTDLGSYGVSGDDELAGSVITLHVGFYDWITSSAPVFALIPIALAVGVGVAVSQLVRDADRTSWAAAAGFALSALVLAASVAVKPASAVEITGPLGRRLAPSDLPVNRASSLDVAYGPGLIIAVVALVVVCGLATWQYVATGRSATEPGQDSTTS